MIPLHPEISKLLPSMQIELSDETTKRAVASIRRYFAEHLEREVGELPARLLLEFFVKEIGPSGYNAAIADAQVYLRDRIADLEGVCYMPEFEYWLPKQSGRPRR